MNDQPPAPSNTLRYVTIAFGVMVVGAAILGLGRTLGPTADQQAEETAARFDLSLLNPGQPVTIDWLDNPVIVLRLTSEQESLARSIDITDLLDPLARNAMLPPDAPASFENRTIDSDGPIVVMNAQCDHMGFIATYSDRPENTWFCMRGAEEFDPVGRRLITNGLGADSIGIPPHTVTEDGHLILLTEQELLLLGGVDRLIYGSGD
ncbi:hypothetical protein [Gymnodinialimonas hymeniacidonis]|uniref:hypothetical protein n=1 Tax=Gymnodinialimonas hymeniacidonis TaxID=3126508 RepID=UPI0034C60F9C